MSLRFISKFYLFETYSSRYETKASPSRYLLWDESLSIALIKLFTSCISVIRYYAFVKKFSRKVFLNQLTCSRAWGRLHHSVKLFIFLWHFIENLNKLFKKKSLTFKVVISFQLITFKFCLVHSLRLVASFFI